MKIAIDARSASHPQPGGLRAYTRGLIDGLNIVTNDNQYVLYTDRQSDLDLCLGENFKTHILPGRPRLLGAGWREQVVLPKHLGYAQCDIVHFPCNTAAARCSIPFVVTIHDLIPTLHSRRLLFGSGSLGLVRYLMRTYARFFTDIAARKAVAIITDSRTSQQELLGQYGLPPERIFVIPLAPSSIFRPQYPNQAREIVVDKFGFEGKYILAIGSVKPSKNVQRLIQAYARLCTELVQEYHLAVVWTHGSWDVFQETIRKWGLERRVVFLSAVSDEDLVTLYSGASLFVFPSLHEGFGLPILEAMACGTPVVTSNVSSMPEVAGNAAILVDPYDPNHIAQGISGILENEQLGHKLIEKGRDRTKAFSWEKTAKQTLAVYEQVAHHLACSSAVKTT